MSRFRHFAFALALALHLAPSSLAGDGRATSEERIVAGGASDFMTVRHLRLSGTQFEIGRALAEIARDRHGWKAPTDVEPLRTAAQRRYFERNAPCFLERMSGVAAAIGASVADDARNLSGLEFGFAKPGCTVVYYPPLSTAWGTGVVSRNFDFTTGTFLGKRPGPGEVAVCSAVYVLELHPTRGYASLSICAYDLLGGVVDGMNEEGLTIALLADDEAESKFPMRPAKGPQAGFGVLQVGRHVLETCANVEEAERALLEAKLYYESIPCHYLVADRHGRSFVWENSVSLSQGFIFEGDGSPQVTTNFLYQLHDDLSALPEEPHPSGSFNRYRAVLASIAEKNGKLELDDVRRANRCVAATAPSPPAPWAPGRTLWHALYFPEERRLEVDFYLGEGEDGAIRRSPPATIQLAARVSEATAGSSAKR
jgi:hypothetical protein